MTYDNFVFLTWRNMCTVLASEFWLWCRHLEWFSAGMFIRLLFHFCDWAMWQSCYITFNLTVIDIEKLYFLSFFCELHPGIMWCVLWTAFSGFSRTLMQILNDCNATFSSFDILSDESVRQGMQWFCVEMLEWLTSLTAWCIGVMAHFYITLHVV